MEQELLKDEIETADDDPAEDFLQTSASEAVAAAPIELEPPANAHLPSDPVDLPTSEDPADRLEIVDPYTAAPPSLGFVEPQPEHVSSGANGDPVWQNTAPFEDPFVPIPYAPATPGENIRRSGLAWSAGVAFFGSVAFTLFLGWLADLLLGTSPWGIVGGIVLGSIIGFLQFFRITSQIFPSKDSGPVETTLIAPKDDEQP
jgi:hypothetical protein